MNIVKLGIMQGRLSNVYDNDNLDLFPFESWESEFRLASKLGFQTIELVVDKSLNKNNPIWSKEGKVKIIDYFSTNHLSPYSACLNFIIDFPIYSKPIFEKVCQCISILNDIGVNLVILPLFESSNPNIHSVKKALCELNMLYSKNNFEIVIESELNAQNTNLFLHNIPGRKIGIVYDIGNTSFLGHSVHEDLYFLEKKISHIHLKDKNSVGANVNFGLGIVNFEDFFNHPVIESYQEWFTFETSREENPTKSAQSNLNYISMFTNKFV